MNDNNTTDNYFRVRSFGVIWIRISDPRSPGSSCVEGTDESTLDTDPSKPAFSNSSGFKSVLVWAVGLTVEIKLRFQIPLA